MQLYIYEVQIVTIKWILIRSIYLKIIRITRIYENLISSTRYNLIVSNYK